MAKLKLKNLSNIGDVLTCEELRTPVAGKVNMMGRWKKNQTVNYGKALPQTKEMLGTAEIVVKDKRLIENLIQPVEKLLRE